MDKCESSEKSEVKVEAEVEVDQNRIRPEVEAGNENRPETSLFTYLIILFFAMIAGMILNGESG